MKNINMNEQYITVTIPTCGEKKSRTEILEIIAPFSIHEKPGKGNDQVLLSIGTANELTDDNEKLQSVLINKYGALVLINTLKAFLFSTMKPPLKQGAKDDFQTPPDALQPLYKFLKPGWTIWECPAGKGNLSRALRKKGFKVISTDILSGHDFLEYEPKDYDCIITNPPFSLKQEFLQRVYCLGKPFAFLLPLTTLESAKRQFLFRCCGLELILFDHRINFETPDGEGEGSWLATAWFTNGLKIGKELTFVSKDGVKRLVCRLSCD